MPKNKPKQQNINSLKTEIYKKITPGMALITLVEEGDKARNLNKHEKKTVTQFTKIAFSYLQNNTLNKDLRARCLCTYWISLNTLYFDAYLTLEQAQNQLTLMQNEQDRLETHKKIQAQLNVMQNLKERLNTYYKEMFALMHDFLANPTSETLEINTKHRIYPLSSYYMQSFCQIPALFAIAVIIADNTQIEVSTKQLSLAVEQFEIQSALFQEVAPILAKEELNCLAPFKNPLYLEQNRLSVQFNRARTLNSSLIKLLQDTLSPPEKASDSCANSLSGLIPLLKTDPLFTKITAGIERLNQITPITARSMASASSSSGSIGEESLVLRETLDSAVIDAEFQKLIRCVDTPSFARASIETKPVLDWIKDPVRVRRLINNLTKYITTNFPNSEQNERLLASGQTVSFNLLKNILNENQQCISLIMYFFKIIQRDKALENHPVTYQLVKLIWGFKDSFSNTVNLTYRFDAPNGELSWLHTMESFYSSSFESIYPPLFKIIFMLLLNKPIPGFDDFTIKNYKDNIYNSIDSMFTLLRFQAINYLYQNEVEKTVKTSAAAQQLHKTVSNNLQQLSKYTGNSVLGMQMHWDIFIEPLLRFALVLKEPMHESIRIAQKLHTIEVLIDESLLAKEHQQGNAPDVPNLLNFELNDLCIKIETCFSKDDPLLEVLPLIENKLLPILPNCFGMDLEHNLTNAHLILAILSLCIQQLSSEIFSQQILLNKMKLYYFRIDTAKTHWQEQVEQKEQSRVKNFLQLLGKDKTDLVPFHEAESIRKFQPDFQKKLFVMVLDNALHTSSQRLDFYEMGALVQLTDKQESAGFLHDKVLGRLYSSLRKSLVRRPLQEAKAIYSIWDTCLPAFLSYLQRSSENQSAISHLYLDIFDIKYDEANRYYCNGLHTLSLVKLDDASFLLEKISSHFNPSDLLLARQKIESLGTQIKDIYSPPYLLTYMLDPHIPSANSLDTVPPKPESPDFYQAQMLSLQNAWQQLQRASEKNLRREDVCVIFKTWKSHFESLAAQPNTLAQLQLRWREHYRQCLASLPEASALKAKKAASSQPNPNKSKQLQTRSKNNWNSFQEERRLEELDRFNQIHSKARAERKGKGKEKIIEQQKITLQNITYSDSAAASSSLDETQLPVKSVAKAISNNKVLAKAKIVRKDSMAPIFSKPHNFFSISTHSHSPQDAKSKKQEKLFFSYASVVKGFPIYQADFPSHPVCQASAVCGSSAVSAQPLYSLDPTYKHPDTVQIIMDTIQKAGFLVLLGGGYVRDILRGALPNDADIFTNCPSDRLTQLIPNVIPSNKLSSVLCIPATNGELGIDIKYIPSQTPLDIASKLDFRVNTFFIDASGKLIVPLDAAYTDLEKQDLQSVIPIEDSFTFDISRLWRMVRLSNQLVWPIDEIAQASIKRFAPQLCDFSISQFITHFKKCFINNEALAFKNLSTFHELGLLPYLVANTAESIVIDAELFSFCKEELTRIFRKNEEDRFIDILALFALLPKASSLASYFQQIEQWISAFETKDHHPQIIQNLRTILPERLKHYYNKWVLPKFNISAEPFDPYYHPPKTFFWSGDQTGSSVSDDPALIYPLYTTELPGGTS